MTVPKLRYTLVMTDRHGVPTKWKREIVSRAPASRVVKSEFRQAELPGDVLGERLTRYFVPGWGYVYVTWESA